MPAASYSVLLVDPDARMRALLAEQLRSTGCVVLQAADGNSAMEILSGTPVRLVVTELYLRAGDDDDLIHAIRRVKALRRTRAMALTSRATAADRDWAMRAGADAYLVKPTRAERFRYVVTRLSTTRGANANVALTSGGPLLRRDTLEAALADIEGGRLSASTCIVFSRKWWDELSPAQRGAFNTRATRAGVALSSDSVLGNHFVEVHGSPAGPALVTERQESPYRE